METQVLEGDGGEVVFLEGCQEGECVRVFRSCRVEVVRETNACEILR